jgi:hypothetical protein
MDIIGERTKLFLSFIFQDNWPIAGKIIKLKLIYLPDSRFKSRVK